MNNRSAKDEFEFKTITPSILYFGNPVAIVSSINHDGSPNLAPVSSFWPLGWTVILGSATRRPSKIFSATKTVS